MGQERRCAMVAQLFEAYFERVYRFARRSADPATAEEIAQDVFLRLLSQEGLEDKSVSVSYLIKIAHNMLKRRHRRAERARRFHDTLARNTPGPSRHSAEPDPHADAGTHLGDAFDRLGHEERLALRLIVCREHSYEEAAAMLGVRASTVNNWKYRALQRLKSHPGVGHDGGTELLQHPERRRSRPGQATRPNGPLESDEIAPRPTDP